jgi:hypothetical protein
MATEGEVATMRSCSGKVCSTIFAGVLDVLGSVFLLIALLANGKDSVCGCGATWVLLGGFKCSALATDLGRNRTRTGNDSLGI